MNKIIPDKSGIYSLGGFAYQIKVFIYFLKSLNEGAKIEFEKIEDISITKSEEIEKSWGSLCNKIIEDDSHTVIQVKRTSLSQSDSFKVLLNWLLLEKSELNIEKYILLTDDFYKNKDTMFIKSAKECFDKIISSKSKTDKSTISKVKKNYANNYTQFEIDYLQIKKKYSYQSLNDIDQLINDGFSIHFRRVVNKVVYNFRITELITHITGKVLSSIGKGQPYTISYNEFMKIVEDITIRISEEIMIPSYIDFKKANPIDLEDLKIASSREFHQLVACGIDEKMITRHLEYNEFYKDYKFMHLENNKISLISNLEETAYDNFEDAKVSLQKKNEDDPYNRLEETKNRSNSYSNNNQIRYGVAINLTGEETAHNQISWSDD